MISTEIKDKVNERLSELVSIGNNIFGNVEMPILKYGEIGSTGAYAYPKDNIIELNIGLVKENLEYYLSDVIPHELSHLIAYNKYNSSGHDKYWKHVMLEFGVEPKRLHSMNTANVIKRNTKYFLYNCGCDVKDYPITSRKHNKILKGARYRCSYCKELVQWSGKQTTKKDLLESNFS